MNRGSETEDPSARMEACAAQRARGWLRRKHFPIEVTYLAGVDGEKTPKIKVVAQDLQSKAPLAVIPLGSLGVDGVGVCCLRHGESCSLRPGGSEEIVVRVFDSGFVNKVLHDGVAVQRGGRVVIVPSAAGGMKCFTRERATPYPDVMREQPATAESGSSVLDPQPEL